MLKFLSNLKTASLNKCKSEKYYIHNLLDLLNNPTKFQLKWIRIQSFQLTLFNIAVTLKYGQVTESGSNS